MGVSTAGGLRFMIKELRIVLYELYTLYELEGAFAGNHCPGGF